MLYSKAVFRTAGDRSIVMEFADVIDPQVLSRILSMASAIEGQADLCIEEILPTYCSLQFFYSPHLTTPDELKEKLRKMERSLPDMAKIRHRQVSIPVLYGGIWGPDLAFVAEHNGLTEEDVIRIHSDGDYLLYMLGFTPGFGYLGGMNEKISAPRLTEPRLNIPAGSCGIAGSQTGIYPVDSPGGWRLIGRTPLRLFDPLAQHPILLQPGDKIRFFPIDENEFIRISLDVEKNIYTPSIVEENLP